MKNNLNKILTSLVFSSENQITTSILPKVAISKFDDGYIICIINDKIYLFDEEGKFKFEGAISRNRHPDYYTLVTKEVSNQYRYFYITFIKENYIYLYLYDYIPKDLISTS